MRELREDTFSGDKNEDAHNHVDRVLNIELSTLGTSLKKPLSNGIVHHPRLLNDLKTSTTSSRKAMNRYTKLENGPHLDKEYPLNKEVKQLEEVKYREFGHSAPFNESNGAKFRMGPSGYYTSTDNRPPYGEKIPSLEELMNKHKEESARKNTQMDEWIKKLQENAEINTRNQSASFKNLKTQIKQLTKELQSRTTNGAPNLSTRQCKVVNADHKMPNIPISSSKLNNLHEVSFLSDSDSQVTQNNKERTKEVLQCKLPPKEQNPGNFTLPCTIGNFNFYAIADLRASVNTMPRGIFEFLKLTNLRKTNMLIEVADMTKKAPLGVVENIIVGIDKFLSPYDFVNFTWGSNNEPSCPSGNPSSKSLKTDNLQDRQEQQVIDCFEEALDPDKDPMEISFDDYKWVFDLEIE
ncbi:phospholipase-like protein [Tanacetum coccineum]